MSGRSFKFRVSFYLNLIICISHQTYVGLFIIWTAALLIVWVILDDHKTLLFLVTRVSSLFQLGTFNLYLSRLSTFRIDDLIAFLILLFLEPCVLPSREVLKFSFLFQHLFELSENESHFIVCGLFKFFFPDLLDSTIYNLRALDDLFFCSLLELVCPNLRATKSLFGRWSLLWRWTSWTLRMPNSSSHARVFMFIASWVGVVFGSHTLGKLSRIFKFIWALAKVCPRASSSFRRT